MSGLHANTGGMDVDGTNTVANAELFATELGSLQSNISGLLTIWHGPAAAEFNKAYEDQNHNLQAFQQLLSELGGAISSGAGILNDTEEENAARASGLY